MAPEFFFEATPLEKMDHDELVLITGHRGSFIIGQELNNGLNFAGNTNQTGDTVTAKSYTKRIDILFLSSGTFETLHGFRCIIERKRLFIPIYGEQSDVEQGESPLARCMGSW